MSGIVTLWERGGVDPATLRAMHDRLVHRGPDGGDVWEDGDVGLGHQKLRSTPEGRYDEQPHGEDGLVVTADARLDNRPELFSKLQLDAHPARCPDSRLLLAAYREWGCACVDHLVGAYAVVIWDGDSDRLFCARDHFGVKPLYYHSADDVFAVASEKKALLELPSVPGEVDETKVGDFLVDDYDDTARSFFRRVDRLPPAHAMTVESGETTRWRYWDLDPTRTVSLGSDRAYERRFRELFEQAVESRLRTPTGVGTALSGGMDSSSITVVARDLLTADETLQTFSNVFDDAPSSDEREFIETVTEREGIEPHYVFLDDVGSLVDEPELRRYFDQPPHNTMHFGEWERTKRADEVGVDAVLGGALGDSAIGYGLGLLAQLFWTGRWRRLAGELRQMAEILDASRRELFVRHVLSEMVPAPLLQWRRQRRGQRAPLEAANPTLDPAFVERIDLRSRYTDPESKGAWFTPRSRRRQRRSLLTGKNASNFETLDLTHAAFGIEPRYPFADKRLVEFSLAIPPSQQFKDGWTRSIGRRALGDLLPEKIQWRPWKTFVTEGFANALGREGDRLTELVADPNGIGNYVDPEALRAAHRRFSEEPRASDSRALWRALSLSVWLDEYGRETGE